MLQCTFHIHLHVWHTFHLLQSGKFTDVLHKIKDKLIRPVLCLPAPVIFFTYHHYSYYKPGCNPDWKSSKLYTWGCQQWKQPSKEKEKMSPISQYLVLVHVFILKLQWYWFFTTLLLDNTLITDRIRELREPERIKKDA